MKDMIGSASAGAGAGAAELWREWVLALRRVWSFYGGSCGEMGGGQGLPDARQHAQEEEAVG